MGELDDPNDNHAVPRLGGDLSAMSLEALADYIAILQAEIARVEADRNAKKNALHQAESFFR